MRLSGLLAIVVISGLGFQLWHASRVIPSSSSTTLKEAADVRQPAGFAAGAIRLAATRHEEEEALKKPLVVAIKTGHYLGSGFPPHEAIAKCQYKGQPIDCQWVQAVGVPRPDADALWYHIPHTGSARRDAPGQLTVGFSMEGAGYYPALNDMNIMDQFDIEMDYRTCAHVWTGYFFSDFIPIHSSHAGYKEPIPFEEKRDAIAFVNRNCAAVNGRTTIIQELMAMKRIPVHAHGSCLNNIKEADVSNTQRKREMFRKYKFCITMESSTAHDYFTEKIFDGFEAGCIPIYLGCPNIKDFVPATDSYLDYANFTSSTALMDFIEKVAHDKELYESFMAWKRRPISALNPGYRKAVAAFANTWGPSTGNECTLCQLLMDLRLHPRNLTKTHCLRNKAWMAAEASRSSSWPAYDMHAAETAAH